MLGYLHSLYYVHDRMTVTKFGPEDGTHVSKSVILNSKLCLLEIVLF
jgi:hypothetical protein